MYWNINGFIDMIKTPEVSGWLAKNFDIVFLSETHMTKGQAFKIHNFKCINHPFSDAMVKKPRGGMTCMVKHKYMQYVTRIDRDTPDNINVRFHGGHTIFGSYIPPVDSLYYNDICFTHIPNTFRSSEKGCVVIGGGDLNSRVGNVTQKLPLLGAKYRPNVDATINSHGRLLRKICNSYECYILNNLNVGNVHCDGDYTFYKGNKRSQNDVCVSNLKGIQNLRCFSIHKIGWNFSDHLPVSFVVNMDLYDSSILLAASSDILSSYECESRKRPRKVISTQVDWNGYGVIARREMEMLYDKVESLQSQPNSNQLNEVVNTLFDQLYKAAKTCETKVDKVIVPM